MPVRVEGVHVAGVHRVSGGVAALTLLVACSSAPLPSQAPGARQDGEAAVALDVEGEPLVASAQPTVGDDHASAPAGAAGQRVEAARAVGSARPAPAPRRGAVTPPRAPLFAPHEDRVGITTTELHVCAHVPIERMGYVGVGPSDIDGIIRHVTGGRIHGRRLVVRYEDDKATAPGAVLAMSNCASRPTFLYLGGAGYDQIPAARTWAERHRVPYVHHMAPGGISTGHRYSFTHIPTTERVGVLTAEVAATLLERRPVGILHRDSAYWRTAVTAFQSAARRLGVPVVAVTAVKENQGNYLNEIIRLRDAGAQVVWVWEDVLGSMQFVHQAADQQWSPRWLLQPYNLISQGGDALIEDRAYAVSGWQPYSNGDRSGLFAQYADALDDFEVAVRRSNSASDAEVKLTGPAGDLLFQIYLWVRQVASLLDRCGPDCTRNRLTGLFLDGLRQDLRPSCPVDFSRDAHRGGRLLTVVEPRRSPRGLLNWVPKARCIETMMTR